MERGKCWAECHAGKAWADRISCTGFWGGFLWWQSAELFARLVVDWQFCRVVVAMKPTWGEPRRQRNRSSALSQTHVEAHAEENGA